MSESRHPAVPRFTDPWLDRLALAVGNRAKTISYNTALFTCSREEAPSGECLYVDLQVGKSTRISVIIWVNGAMYLGVHTPGPARRGGWRFKYERDLDLSTMDAGEFVAALERTIGQAYTPNDTTTSALDKIWDSAELLGDDG